MQDIHFSSNVTALNPKAIARMSEDELSTTISNRIGELQAEGDAEIVGCAGRCCPADATLASA
jgi:hypothetical protein